MRRRMMYNVADVDVKKFLEATNISNKQIKDAINDLVLALKRKGLWNKMAAIYPFVGGSASEHKYNLRDISKYSLGFFLGVSHNSYGITFTDGYANTGMKNSDISNDISNSFHASLYVPIDVSKNIFDWTFTNDSDSNRLSAHLKYSDGGSYFDFGNCGNGRISTTISNTSRLSVFNKIGNTQSIYLSGKLISSKSNTLSIGDLGTMLIHKPTYTVTSNKSYSFISFGEGLTNSDISNLTDAVNAFQSALGRAV